MEWYRKNFKTGNKTIRLLLGAEFFGTTAYWWASFRWLRMFYAGRLANTSSGVMSESSLWRDSFLIRLPDGRLYVQHLDDTRRNRYCLPLLRYKTVAAQIVNRSHPVVRLPIDEETSWGTCLWKILIARLELSLLSLCWYRSISISEISSCETPVTSVFSRTYEKGPCPISWNK